MQTCTCLQIRKQNKQDPALLSRFRTGKKAALLCRVYKRCAARGLGRIDPEHCRKNLYGGWWALLSHRHQRPYRRRSHQLLLDSPVHRVYSYVSVVIQRSIASPACDFLSIQPEMEFFMVGFFQSLDFFWIFAYRTESLFPWLLVHPLSCRQRYDAHSRGFPLSHSSCFVDLGTEQAGLIEYFAKTFTAYLYERSAKSESGQIKLCCLAAVWFRFFGISQCGSRWIGVKLGSNTEKYFHLWKHKRAKKCRKRPYFDWNTVFLVGAGTGLEPATSGLWARRATSCSTLRYWFFTTALLNSA